MKLSNFEIKPGHLFLVLLVIALLFSYLIYSDIDIRKDSRLAPAFVLRGANQAQEILQLGANDQGLLKKINELEKRIKDLEAKIGE